MSDPWGDIGGGGGGEGEGGGGRSCPWCSAEAGPSDTKCPKCGAALAQREAIGDLVIPGVTNVDPEMRSADSPTAPLLRGQIRYATVNTASSIGGPSAGIVTAAAILAPDYLGGVLAGFGGAPDASHVGEVSEAARLAAERLDRGDPAAPDQAAVRPTQESGAPPAGESEPGAR